MTKKFTSRQTGLPLQPAKSLFSPRPFAPAVQAKVQDNATAAPSVEHSPQNSNLLSRLTHSESVSESQQIGSELGIEGPKNQHKIQRKHQDNLTQLSALPPTPPSASGFPIQAKLTVGAAGDKYEQEADYVARQVVNRIQAPQVNLNSSESNPVQRKISIQALGGEGGDVSSEWEGQLNQARGGGQPLTPSFREAMEREFGADFSGVRVHTGGQADNLAKSIQAKAFTTGQDVFFRRGAYEPGSRGGQELIAHELTHVVQQRGGGVKRSLLHRRQEKPTVEATVEPIQAKGDQTPNQTELPDNLKARVENLSGYALDDVRVHYNSPKPAQLQALAYAQGTAIHVAPRQDEHLPHEVWHVVQQMQGRVKPTIQMKGLEISDDKEFEREANMMGVFTQEQTGDQLTMPTIHPQQRIHRYSSHSNLIQRSLRSGAEFKQDISENSCWVKSIADDLDEYAQLEQLTNPTVEDVNNMFFILRWIDRYIYNWLDNVSKSNEKLPNNEYMVKMKTLLSQTAKEHIMLVDRYKNNVDVLPFSLGNMDENDAKTVWQSIVNSQGKIKLVGDREYNKDMLSLIAKILNTDTGKKLIQFLNTSSPHHPLTDEMSNIYLGNAIDQVPLPVRQASPEVKELHESKAAPLGNDNNSRALGIGKNVDMNALPNTLGDLKTATDFRDAVFDPSKMGVAMGGMQYDFNKGTGSFVYVHGDEPSNLAGNDFHEILGPRFITLAHELGHAAHMKRGATAGTDSHNGFMETFSTAGTSVPGASDVWDNSEEFNVITNFENAIREESGMVTQRTGHRDAELLRAQDDYYKDPQKKELADQRAYNLALRLNNLVPKVMSLIDTSYVDPLGKVSSRISKIDTKRLYHNDTYYQIFNSEVTMWENNLSDAHIQKIQDGYWKKIQIGKHFINQLYSKAKKIPNNLKIETKRVNNIIDNNLTDYITRGKTSEYNLLLQDIQTLQEGLIKLI